MRSAVLGSLVPLSVPDQFLTTKEVANLLHMSVVRLEQDRYKRRGLPYLRLGRTIRYRLDHINAYLENCVVQPRPEA